MARSDVLAEVRKWAIVAVAVALVGVLSTMQTGNQYSKAEVDRQIDQVYEHHDKDIDRLIRQQEQAQESLDWLVRNSGGEPIRDGSEEDR